MIWVNGEARDTIEARDRAVQFGDGCFTTARVQQGRVQRLAAHLQRLQQGCERLRISGVDWMALEAEIIQATVSCDDGVLKAILTRGSGGRGYSAQGCQKPGRIISLSAYPAHYHQLRQKGARLVLSSVRLGKNPQLAGIKHLNRLEQVLIRTELEQTGADEALVLDSDAMLVECCAANLFWRVGKQVFTPDLSSSGVNGIQRQRVMKRVVQLGYTLSEVRAGIDVLAAAEEVLITNALMPVLPVYQAECWHYASRQLFNLLNPIVNDVENDD
ncbi:aminodeoxychorismate lyase [Erwinia pyrifoliae]|uniref:aminodeoxychorismate lyase n=1 Tax=Erwinia pyrifoliae TaxID=79967 RepID=UPI000196088F|nr:aminodeoxychorismate lyase [Erwinia pyrifoliae]AUX72393.1 aminodeoxychorismate lyase [Erwinia pyrifoliae]MCA8877361.1 aminodeoxychorismate lyase [Erwinia pyrifoliae]UWS30738.1 aminodeoxychorismate lyase [Erwinia pyrifoliae]UXK13751.1 aminodeoxychorismate lyase [Erwinia pyrifoliae]CAX55924.1 4-amino-4-deoxychorismate lyase [Erwinia pyrifoliae Ep1/96]